LVDLTLDYVDAHGKTITIEAFKTRTNDDIIEKKQTEKYGLLNWLSIGNPIITTAANKTNFIHFTPKGEYLN